MVVAIWGAVFFRIKKMKNGDNKYLNTLVQIDFADKTDVRRSGNLLLNYDDPFLKSKKKIQAILLNEEEHKEIEKNQDNLTQSKGEEVTHDASEYLIQQIKYYGFIGTKEQNDEVGFVGYKDESFIIREGESFKNLTVETITSDSLIVEYENKSFVVPVLHSEDETVIFN
jgi:hypothetical protein